MTRILNSLSLIVFLPMLAVFYAPAWFVGRCFRAMRMGWRDGSGR